MARVLLSVPTGDGLIWSMVDEALGNLDRGGHEIVQRNVSFYGVDEAREIMAQTALDEGCDYLFMVDSDTVVPENALVDLMSNGVDVCLGYYERGSDDGGRTAVIEIGHNDYRVSYQADELKEMRDDGDVIVRVKGGGMGCALIRTVVFDRIPKPWFLHQRNQDGSSLGEDYYFCEKCGNNGVHVYVDTRVGCDHLKLTYRRMRDGKGSLRLPEQA